MNKRSKDKKAQFFIIGAVILGIIILSMAGVWNVVFKGKEDVSQKKFQALCENYKHEVFEISKYVVTSGNKSHEGNAIFEFTNEFLEYTKNSEPNFSLIYVYGNNSNVTVYSYEPLTTSPGITWQSVNGYLIGYASGDWMNISNEKINKSYKLYEDERFYFIGLEEKEGEFYICE